MENSKWELSDTETYFSYHITVTYYGDKLPKYHVLENPDGEGWVIGVFYGFIGGEYVPLDEDGEERLVFPTAEDAMNYADMVLES